MAADCVFCSLLNGDGSADWVWRGPLASALLPRRYGWLAPGHTLVISNEHAVGVQDVSSDCLQEVALLVQRVAQQMAATIGAQGVNVLNASGQNSDQSVDHLHFHVVPRWADDGLDTWVHGKSSHVLGAGWLDDLRAGLLSTGSDSR
ncbi:HIT family protein [Microlunatus endophyticus]|uniref:HIT family protein n=1 Tax=Microlunatus endophyticus TaxID=1716077 RepID=UPI00166E4E50|nr:HIT family protein [Microlunatus endophyticus]